MPNPSHIDDQHKVATTTLDHLIVRNRAWARRKTQADPHFFERLLGQQRPAYFWIGCSDSRVPATEIVDLDPGEMFVHRNVANLAPADDPNFAAALTFAVDELRVRDIIVVGHYGCGGIHTAAHGTAADNAVGRWLAPIRALYRQHQAALAAIEQTGAREDRLCELNVAEQVRHLAANPIIARAWANGHDLNIHGLVYGIGDGLIATTCDAISHHDTPFPPTAEPARAFR